MDKRGVEGSNLEVEPPHAEFKVSSEHGFVPLTVKFTDRSSGEITDWLWDFGDGTTSDKRNPVHTYREQGKYSVKLTVTGPGGSHTAEIDSCIEVKGFLWSWWPWWPFHD